MHFLCLQKWLHPCSCARQHLFRGAGHVLPEPEHDDLSGRHVRFGPLLGRERVQHADELRLEHLADRRADRLVEGVAVARRDQMRVQRAHALQRAFVGAPVERVERTGAKERERLCVGELVPEALDRLGRVAVAVGADGSNGITRRCIFPSAPVHTARVLEVLTPSQPAHPSPALPKSDMMATECTSKVFIVVFGEGDRRTGGATPAARRPSQSSFALPAERERKCEDPNQIGDDDHTLDQAIPRRECVRYGRRLRCSREHHHSRSRDESRRESPASQVFPFRILTKATPEHKTTDRRKGKYKSSKDPVQRSL